MRRIHLLRRLKRWIRQVVESVGHMAVWLPVIWRDRDWDYVFLLKLIDFKLARMLDHFEQHALLTEEDLGVISGQISRARYLLRGLIEQRFEHECYEDWEGAWGNLRTSFRYEDGHRISFTSPEDRPQADALITAMIASQTAENAALVELCQTLMLMERWWD